MSCCPPTCAIPSCPQPCCPQPCSSSCSYPTGGLGSLDCCSASGCSSACCGTSTSARCLGITSGANVACISQLPSSEVCIQPPPVVVTCPGPILAATCEPLRVGGYTACGGSSSSICGTPSCGRLTISGSCKPSGYQGGSKVC